MIRLALLLWFLLGSMAFAHDGRTGYSEVLVEGQEVGYLLEIPAHYLPIGTDPGLPADPAAVRAKLGEVSRFVAENLGVTSGGPPATFSLEVEEAQRDNSLVGLVIRYRFERPVEDLRISYRLFDPQEPSFQNMASIHVGSKTYHAAFSPQHSTWRQGGGLLQTAASYGVLGIEHILTGFDHLAFVMGLLLVGNSLRGLATLITGFTVGHSATLIAAALGLVSLPGSLIEPAIALSVAYVGIENIVIARRTDQATKGPDRRWLLAFAFGLLHGFGFSGVLSELGLPAEGLLASLLSFNLGVELGQIAVVAVAFPLVLLLRRVWGLKAMIPLSGLVAVVGILWFFERVAG